MLIKVKIGQNRETCKELNPMGDERPKLSDYADSENYERDLVDWERCEGKLHEYILECRFCGMFIDEYCAKSDCDIFELKPGSIQVVEIINDTTAKLYA
jgi:hypothetical protein